MNPVFDTETIDEYLLGRLSKEDEQQFERVMQAHPNLAEEVAMHRAVIIALEEEEMEAFLNMVEDKPEDPIKRKKPGRGWTLFLFSLAAAVVLLLVWMQLPSPEEQLVEKHFRMDRGWPSPLGAPVRASALEEAMSHYRQGELSLAEEGLELLLGVSPGNDTLLYFLGQIALAESDGDQAQGYFKQVITQGGSEYQVGAEWGLSLAEILEGEWEEARKRLEKIATNPRHYHWRDAEAILKEFRPQSL